ncbi:MAG TPA: MarR family transcriptional regulator [Acidimicrobiales bacterium]|nr:MarR family transcriptional regulator [Acidimicrobiales bacterium]
MRNLVRLSDVLVDAVNRRLRVHGLHLATAQALSVLEGADNALTPNEIGEHLHLTSGTVTTVIDSLEKRNLVERKPHPQDRRKVLVSITDAGRVVLDRYLPEAVAIQTAMLGGLNDDELQALSKLLTRALRSTDGIDPHAVAEAAAPRRRVVHPDEPARSRRSRLARPTRATQSDFRNHRSADGRERGDAVDQGRH